MSLPDIPDDAHRTVSEFLSVRDVLCLSAAASTLRRVILLHNTSNEPGLLAAAHMAQHFPATGRMLRSLAWANMQKMTNVLLALSGWKELDPRVLLLLLFQCAQYADSTRCRTLQFRFADEIHWVGMVIDGDAVVAKATCQHLIANNGVSRIAKAYLDLLATDNGLTAIKEGFITLENDKCGCVRHLSRELLKVVISDNGRAAIKDGLISLDRIDTTVKRRYAWLTTEDGYIIDYPALYFIVSDSGRAAIKDGLLTVDRAGLEALKEGKGRFRAPTPPGFVNLSRTEDPSARLTTAAHSISQQNVSVVNARGELQGVEGRQGSVVAGEGWQLGQRPQHWPAQVTAADAPKQPWYHSQGKGKGGTGKGTLQGMKGWGRGIWAGEGWWTGPRPQIESYQSSRQGKWGGGKGRVGKGGVGRGGGQWKGGTGIGAGDGWWSGPGPQIESYQSNCHRKWGGAKGRVGQGGVGRGGGQRKGGRGINRQGVVTCAFLW